MTELRATSKKTVKDPFAAWKSELKGLVSNEINDKTTPVTVDAAASTGSTLTQSVQDAKSMEHQLKRLGFKVGVHMRSKKRAPGATLPPVLIIKSISDECVVTHVIGANGIVLDDHTNTIPVADVATQFSVVDLDKVMAMDIVEWDSMSPYHNIEYAIEIVKNIIQAELLSKYYKYAKGHAGVLMLNTRKQVRVVTHVGAAALSLVPMTRGIVARKADTKCPPNGLDLGEIALPFVGQKCEFHLITATQLDPSKTNQWAVPFWLVAKVAPTDKDTINMILEKDKIEKVVVGVGQNAIKVKFELPRFENTCDLEVDTYLKAKDWSVGTETKADEPKAKILKITGKSKPM